MRPRRAINTIFAAMLKLSMELNLLRKPLLVATILIGLKTGVMGQTTEAQNQVDQFSAVSMEAQRLIFEMSQIEGDRAKGIAIKRPIRKNVGRFGNTIEYKSPRRGPSSSRKLIIGRSQSYMSAIP